MISEIAAIDPDWNGLVSQSALESIWLRESCALLVQLLASVKQFLESLVCIRKRLHHFFTTLKREFRNNFFLFTNFYKTNQKKIAKKLYESIFFLFGILFLFLAEIFYFSSEDAAHF